MSHRTAGEVPALDGALEALALGGAGDVDGLDVCEVLNGDLVAAAVLLAASSTRTSRRKRMGSTPAGEVTSMGLLTCLA
jgi:hypothetical protein